METREFKASPAEIIEMRKVLTVLTEYYGNCFFLNYWETCGKWEINCFDWSIWRDENYNNTLKELKEILTIEFIPTFGSKLRIVEDERRCREKNIPFIKCKV